MDTKFKPYKQDQSAWFGSDYIDWLDEVWSLRLAKQPHDVDLTIGILLWPDFPLMSLTGIVESLRHAADFGDNSQPVHCSWSILGDKHDRVRASSGLEIANDTPYSNPTDFDYIMVVGGLLDKIKTAPIGHWNYINAAAYSGVPIVGVCTGSFALASAGLLDGREVCVHPYHRDDFMLAFPSFKITTKKDFIIEKRRATVPGGTSILNFMTHLISTHCGADRATKVVHQLSLTNKAQVGEFDKGGCHDFYYSADPRVQRAVILIETFVRSNKDLHGIADKVGLSDRQLSRLFKQQFGLSPKRYIINTRLRYALWMIENTNQPITAIALETGFSDCAHLSTAFKKKYNRSPVSLRKPNMHY